MQQHHCPKCRLWSAFDGLFEDAYIGRPFFICLTCNATNRHLTRTEWRLKKRKQKLLYFSILARNIFLFGPFLGLLVAVSLQGLFKVPIELTAWFCVISGTVISTAVVVIRAKGKIEKSNERMKDTAYLERLESLGFIRIKRKTEIHGRN